MNGILEGTIIKSLYMKKTIHILLLLALITYGCSNPNSDGQNIELIDLQNELDSLKNEIENPSIESKEQIATFLTFQENNAEEAMNFYVNLFENSEIIEVKRWGKEAPGKEGTIMHATFSLNGNLFMCSNSPAVHEWGFTPAVSNYLDCKNEAELETLFNKLSEGGMVMMPIANYGFSQKFGFLEDQFGVSWQLNLK